MILSKKLYFHRASMSLAAPALVLLSFIFPTQTWAQPSAPSVSIQIKGQEKLMIKASSVQVTWNVIPGSILTIRGLSETQGVKRGDLILFDLKNSLSKEDFQSELKKKKESLRLEISGPSLPVEIYSHEGNFQFSKMSHEIKLHSILGQVVAKQNSGVLNFDIQKGNMVIEQQTGRARLKSYQGQILIKDAGDVDLDVFQGQISLGQIKGNVVLQNYASGVKIQNMDGNLWLENVKGSLQVSQFQGRMEGHSQEGSLTAQLLLDSEVQLKSENAKIHIQLPSQSGAFLNLWTAEGEILTPSELKVNRLPNEKVAKGRVHGSELKKISVSVRNTEGITTIK